MKKVDFKEEFNKILTARNECFNLLKEVISEETIEIARRMIEVNFKFLYEENISITVSQRCFIVLNNALKILTIQNNDIVKKIFTYANLVYSIERLEDETEGQPDTFLLDNEFGDNLDLVFIYNKDIKNCYMFSVYNDRLEERELLDDEENFILKNINVEY